MKVKLFTIRITKNELEIDQNSLNDFLETVNYKKSDIHFIESENSCGSVLVHYEELDETKVFQTFQLEDLSINEQTIFNHLKKWRSEKALENGLKSFMICHNSELMELVVKCPNSKEELKQIKGFGEVKSDKYAEDIIAVLNAV